jgi:hypothetical protein
MTFLKVLDDDLPLRANLNQVEKCVFRQIPVNVEHTCSGVPNYSLVNCPCGIRPLSDLQFKMKIPPKLRCLFSLPRKQSKEQSYEILPASHTSSLLGKPKPAASQRSLLIAPVPSTALSSQTQQKQQTYEALSESHASSLLGTPQPAASQKSLLITPVPSASLQSQTWILDQDFFRQVYDWNENHPENTLDRILNGICTSIDRHKDLLELIPDGPIPFRGFIKALAHLIKLGAVCNPTC